MDYFVAVLMELSQDILIYLQNYLKIEGSLKIKV